MAAHLGTNELTYLIFFPAVVIIAVGIGWLIAKTPMDRWKRYLFILVGLFALVGFTALFLIGYYRSSPVFADTFRIYAYTALAPSGDPFQFSKEEFHSVLMMRDVANIDGEISQVSHPNPDYPTMVALFAPGKYIEADLGGNVFTIPKNEAGSLPRVTKTSLWWALTEDVRNVVSE